MADKYWESGEVPSIYTDGNRVYKHFKKAGIFEMCHLITDENGNEKETRRQTLSAYKIRNNPTIQDMLLSFLEDANLVQKVER